MQPIDLSDKQKSEDAIADWVVGKMKEYEKTNWSKFIGAGVPYHLIERSPKLCSRLWLELDVVSISIAPELEGLRIESKERKFWDSKSVDEQG